MFRQVLFIVLLAGAVLACSAGGPSTERPSQSSPAGAKEQARAALARWDVAFAQAGGQGVAFVGELTNQIGNWEELVGSNNKTALMSGLVRPTARLSTDPPPPGQVTWPDGSSRTVRLVSAAQALAEIASSASSPCPECLPLDITDARLAAGLAWTSRGDATVPLWEFSVAGTTVRITRVAVADRISVVPAPWDPNFSPDGVSIESARGAADSRQLEVTFAGAPDRADKPCGVDYSAEAVESEHAVVVIVIGHRNPAAAMCTLVGARRTAVVDLASPLGDRAVLEAREGLPVPLFGLDGACGRAWGFVNGC
jgi:hypothetical protein